MLRTQASPLTKPVFTTDGHHGPDRTLSFDEFRKTKFFENLDFLRAISVVMVIISHTLKFYNVSVSRFDTGRAGVTLFFAISGFLITTLLLREREKTGEIDLVKFYFRRLLRIFPAYYLALLVYYLYAKYFDQDPLEFSAFQQAMPYYLTNTSVFRTGSEPLLGHAWSLSMEEQFYWVWPVLHKLVSSSKTVFWIGAFLIFSAEASKYIVAHWASHSILFLIPIVLKNVSASIVCGSIVAHLANKENSYRILRKYANVMTPGRIMILFAGSVMLSARVNLPAQLCAACVVTSFIIGNRFSIQTLCRNPLLINIGKASYGMYLFHILPIVLITAKLSHWVKLPKAAEMTLAIGLVTAITYAIARVSLKYYEKPFLRLKSKFEIA